MKKLILIFIASILICGCSKTDETAEYLKEKEKAASEARQKTQEANEKFYNYSNF